MWFPIWAGSRKNLPSETLPKSVFFAFGLNISRKIRRRKPFEKYLSTVNFLVFEVCCLTTIQIHNWKPQTPISQNWHDHHLAGSYNYWEMPAYMCLCNPGCCYHRIRWATPAHLECVFVKGSALTSMSWAGGMHQCRACLNAPWYVSIE